MIRSKLLLFSLFLSLSLIEAPFAHSMTITDMAGRQVEVPETVFHVICSGAGCLRYLSYLGAQDMVVAVDSIEKRNSTYEGRPYALANPQFKNLPLFGEFRGFDNPERILGLNPQPQVIFKTYKDIGYDPDELQTKTGIPVICLTYGNLATQRAKIYASLSLMGKIIGREKRAEDVQSFFNRTIDDLNTRTAHIPDSQRRSCYLGGVAKKGPHGFQSTEPAYPPFLFIHAKNIACPPGQSGKPLSHASVSKEQIVAWDPEIIFMDLSTTQMGTKASGFHELEKDPVYQGLQALKNNRIYTLLPYNFYSINYGSILADAYYAGKVLYPEKFMDIAPKEKADEIYTFLLGKPVFENMAKSFGKAPFEKINLR
ncbi:iron ABC transporter substrate-binding protein [Desulfopila sp. IMCC35008]|uniref:iron ABC transporter substrate-binding protein n=1 Tax=Desulfopila sp. IMCC35008 TaxID=2653858 RepID=UPI0013CFF494|nr:iron ABC transporter substrate-binding protein [Desulfopila sp. IMCC35008]